jgi:hypothetical protein
MDAELKRKWVEALRSGKYQQTRYRMRDRDKFCCLGVLCDLVDPSGWYGCDQWKGHPDMPPDSLCLEIGIAKYAHAPEPSLADCSTMNDRGESFAAIAGYIEANL